MAAGRNKESRMTNMTKISILFLIFSAHLLIIKDPMPPKISQFDSITPIDSSFPAKTINSSLKAELEQPIR